MKNIVPNAKNRVAHPASPTGQNELFTGSNRERPADFPWGLISDIQRALPVLELGQSAWPAKCSLALLSDAADPADSLPEVAALLDNGNEQARIYAQQLRKHVELMSDNEDPDAPDTTDTPDTPSKGPHVGTAPSPQSTMPIPQENAAVAPSSGLIPLAKLEVSKWNRSFNGAMNADHVEALAKSIKQDGLFHPIILIRRSKTDRNLVVLTGANRFEALIEVRGEDGKLEPGEYRILDDLDDDDPRCLDITLAENDQRRDMSPIESAKFIARLTKDTTMSQEGLGNKMGIPREVVSSLLKLSEWYSKLPDSWQGDLDYVPGHKELECDSNHTATITISHWRKVAGCIEKTGVTPELRELMEETSKENLSTKALGERVQNLKRDPKNNSQAATGHSKPNNDTSIPVVASTAQSTGPDFKGLIKALKDATRLANNNKAILEILDTALQGIDKLQQGANENE